MRGMPGSHARTTGNWQHIGENRGHSKCLLASLHWVLDTGATWREILEQFGP